MADPRRGEIWYVDFDPTRGHEQSGRRPALVVSTDGFNTSAAELVVVLPLTTKQKGIPWHVAINPPEGGVKRASFAKCEDVRSIAKERFDRRLGKVSMKTLNDVKQRLRILFELP
jgi:mRNA interferase MazF